LEEEASGVIKMKLRAPDNTKLKLGNLPKGVVLNLYFGIGSFISVCLIYKLERRDRAFDVAKLGLGVKSKMP